MKPYNLSPALNPSPVNLRVMLVDDDARRAALLNDSLLVNGYEVISITSTQPETGLLSKIEEEAPDIVLIDVAFPSQSVLDSLTFVTEHNPVPMLLFAEVEDPEYIKQIFKAGISTYIMQDIDPKKIKPLIDVATAQFYSFQQLKNELKETRQALEEQSLINRAKSILLKEKNLDENEAHKLLTKMSMQHNLKIKEVAKMVLTTFSPNNS